MTFTIDKNLPFIPISFKQKSIRTLFKKSNALEKYTKQQYVCFLLHILALRTDDNTKIGSRQLLFFQNQFCSSTKTELLSRYFIRGSFIILLNSLQGLLINEIGR